MSRLITCYNGLHLGDCLQSIHFINKVCELNDISFEFACKEEYHSQLKELINPSSKVEILPLSKGGELNLWCSDILWRVKDSDPDNYPFYCEKHPALEDVGQMVFKSYEQICLEQNLEFPYKNKFDILFDEEFLKLDSKIGQYDFILINSNCLSGQVHFTTQEQNDIFSMIIEKLISLNKTFITTKKHNEYPCTEDFNLTLGEIGQLSKTCVGIIGVPTSPFWISLNKYSIENGTKYLNITQDGCTYEFNDIITTINSNWSEITNLIDIIWEN